MTDFNGYALAQDLVSVANAKKNLRTAMVNKGIDVAGVEFVDYANLIRGFYIAAPIPEPTPEPTPSQWVYLGLDRPPSDIIWSEYFGHSRDDFFQRREPWKSKAPTGEYDSNGVSYLGAVASNGPFQATIMDMDNRLGVMFHLIKEGFHDPYITYEAECNYRSPRFDYQGPTPKRKRVVELQLCDTNYYDATDYAVNMEASGIEDDHFVVYFPNRLQARTVVVEGYSIYHDGRSNVELLRIQGEVRSGNYGGGILTVTPDNPYWRESPTFELAAGAPGIRFLVTYGPEPLKSRIFIRVKLIVVDPVPISQPELPIIPIGPVE